MFIESIPNRNSRPTILLREGWREAGKVKKRTLANLTDWPSQKVEGLRRLLRGDPVVAASQVSTPLKTLPHGHVEAILGTFSKLDLDELIGTKSCRQRSLVLAMIAQQILDPCSKLAVSRVWAHTTLAGELGVEEAQSDELYEAMDWLVDRQVRIENKLARRHLGEGSQVLYDITSSYYEGRHCPLACYGYNRDGKKGHPIIVYGLLTDRQGCPISIEAFAGNTKDCKTIPQQVLKLRRRFGLKRVVLVGDRGMLTEVQIEHLKNFEGLGWITALRFEAIRNLAEQQYLPEDMSADKNLAEISSPDFPEERLVVCFNPALAEERKRKREELLEATEDILNKIQCEVARRTRKPLGAGEIGKKVGAKINKFKMGKHFALTLQDNAFTYQRKPESIERESLIDGIYVIRTSQPASELEAGDVVRSYKQLTLVERAFRTLKGVDLSVRPLRHREERRIRAHLLICMLAYYVEWHMRQALAPLLFADENLEADREQRSPVSSARPTENGKRKKSRAGRASGLHSFKTLLGELGTRGRVEWEMENEGEKVRLKQVTPASKLQQRAFKLLELCCQ